jgi:hypothetical protein
MVSILTAQMEPSQKFWLLVSNGYTHDVASKLTNYHEGNSLEQKVKQNPQSVGQKPNQE